MNQIQGPGGKVKGYIKETSNGQEVYAPGGRLLGYYDEEQDKTFETGGRYFGTGNQLVALLD